MTTHIKSFLCLSALTLSSLAITAPVAAALQEQTRLVGYSDLDLASASGQKRLETRIRSAVRSVCQIGQGRTVSQQMLSEKCRKSAMESAMTQAKIAIANYSRTRGVASGSLKVKG